MIEYYNGWRFVTWSLGLHFLLSGFVGLSVYWLTSTILSRLTIPGSVKSFSIHQYSLLLAVGFSILAHVLEDYLWGKF